MINRKDKENIDRLHGKGTFAKVRSISKARAKALHKKQTIMGRMSDISKANEKLKRLLGK